LFRKDFKKEDSRHYILYLPDEEKIQDITRSTFVTIHDTHFTLVVREHIFANLNSDRMI
jgi:hypothetical protein